MSEASPLDPRREHDALYSALCDFQAQWEQHRTVQAVFDFCDAVERANEALIALEKKPEQDKEYRLQVVRLKILLTAARQQLELVQQETLETAREHTASEERQRDACDTVLLAGTILACPACGEGLYKLTRRATTQDVVLDEGEILAPLNATIPNREAWRALACPFCGERLLKDGRVHTLQYGWV
jgi:predicted RNA-binding Zn-ribbon protein involved in translation (DUF1610 family)